LLLSSSLQLVVGVHAKRPSGEPPIVTLKIERFRERVRLSGDLRSEDLDQVNSEIERCGTSAVLDVEEVALVDLDGVQFLNRCEANGVAVLNCPAYIREWMSRERTRME
jgi:hypothetical protein